VIDAAHALDLLTIEGAAAIGLGAEIGSIEPGKRADLVVLDTSGPHWSSRPAGSWPATVVACARATDVRTVLVDGQVVATDGYATVQADDVALEHAAGRLRSMRGW